MLTDERIQAVIDQYLDARSEHTTECVGLMELKALRLAVVKWSNDPEAYGDLMAMAKEIEGK